MGTLDSFNFLFADKDDIFFTRHLLMLDFQDYWYLKLRKRGYSAVIFMKPATINETQICCLTEETNKQFEKKAVQLIRGIFIDKYQPIPKSKVQSGKPFTWNMRNNYIRLLLENLFSDDKNYNKQFALVIDIDTLRNVFPDKNSEESFSKMVNNLNLANGSSIDIVCPVSYNEELPYIVRRLLIDNGLDPSEIQEGRDSIVKVRGRVKSEIWEPFDDEQIDRLVQRLRLDNLLYTDDKSYKKLNNLIMSKINAQGLGIITNRRKLYNEMKKAVNQRAYNI